MEDKKIGTLPDFELHLHELERVACGVCGRIHGNDELEEIVVSAWIRLTS